MIVLGAGETSEQTAQALSRAGADTMFVANRHADRALCAGRPLRRRRPLARRLPAKLDFARHRRRLDLVAAADHRPRGAGPRDGRRAGTAAAPDRHRGAARHRAGLRRASPASRSTTSMTSRLSSRATSPRAKRRSRARCRSSRRRSPGSPSGSGSSTRSHDRRCAAAATRSSRAARRERRSLGVDSARPTAAASKRSPTP